ncbi:DUF2726 domain-containing protein [Sphingomonas sp. H39-1-10]|uniref:DUF2726 domain-containing protein n=1 Tax=Sphingomonas pollutisoli TaxID=3030829 RepID=UPI0023B978B0|nr:DUF2726 domain-containing protein [Sphingomonas pollutisoli]MDF0490448.1 DUF2726 domain-containing protein [Sphingomonas pollutisoli]
MADVLAHALTENFGRYLGLAVLILSGMLLIAALGGWRAGGRHVPQVVAKPLLTRREQAMLLVLEQLLPACRIHAQVAMGALLAPPGYRQRRTEYWERNAYARKIVDFVVQDRATGAVIALVEVDDRSHDAERDRYRDEMTARAGYRTIRIPAAARPTLSHVRPAIAGLLPGEQGDRPGNNQS